LPVGDIAAVGFLGAAAWYAMSRAGSSDRAIPRAVDRTFRRQDEPVTVRLQAQGGGLEESVVIQSGPSGQITAADALHGLGVLRASLSPKEAQARASAFARAERFLNSAAAAGGYMGPGQSFAVRGDIRVDIEVRRRPQNPVFGPGGRSDAVIVP
jgi:hypothetical protein